MTSLKFAFSLQEDKKILQRLSSNYFLLKIYFRGETINYITCLTCGTTKERSEHFYDLLLPIKNFNGANNKSIDESIQFLMNPEMLDGGNQYQCETCATKVDAMKGQRFGKILFNFF